MLNNKAKLIFGYHGRTIVDADVIVSLTHFKLHEITGLGTAAYTLVRI